MRSFNGHAFGMTSRETLKKLFTAAGNTSIQNLVDLAIRIFLEYSKLTFVENCGTMDKLHVRLMLDLHKKKDLSPQLERAS